jgi:formiminotetrahydrofolate cyclodeaminase
MGVRVQETISGVVAAAAISGALALRVLKMVLETAARKHESERLGELVRAVEREAARLEELAAEDGAVYAAYMQARREHSPEVQRALRRAIETPLAAARAAAAGIDLCHEADGLIAGAMHADVRGAEALLAGVVRAILCTVEENLRGVEEAGSVREMTAESESLRTRAGAGVTSHPIPPPERSE